jgi:catechol 2,3-dioxygenase-like lactoylglutathione lyase family enzyme
MVAQLTHIALRVADMERSIAFYSDWCDMKLVHERPPEKDGDSHVAWLSSPDYEGKFVLVLMDGRQKAKQPTAEYSEAERIEHLGFGVERLSEVFAKASRGKEDGNLHWDVMELGYPVGTLCAVTDPDGNIIEFSHGQPIGFKNYRYKTNGKEPKLK